MKEHFILIRYGELALKKKETRRRFESALKKNITQAFRDHDLDCFLETTWGRIFVHTSNVSKGIDILKHVFGIISVSPVVLSSSILEDLSDDLLSYLKGKLDMDQSFALRITRTGGHEYTSQDAAFYLGDKVRTNFLSSVDLTNPDVEVFIEIRDKKAYIFLEKFPGPGGMPSGTQGKICSIVQSTDDVLAAWYLLRRGCSMVFYVADKTVESSLNHLFSVWNVHSQVFYSGINDDLVECLDGVMRSHHCEALCIGISFSKTNDEVIGKIKMIKKKIHQPILTPLIAMPYEKIMEMKRQLELEV